MLGRGASVALLLLATLAYGEPVPKAVDITAYKDKLIVLKDAEGGVYAVTYEKGGDKHVFFGTTKVLHEAIYDGGGGRDGDAWHVSVHAPRVPYPFMGSIQFRKDGSYRMTCGEKKTLELTEITGDARKAIIDKAKFLTT